MEFKQYEIVGDTQEFTDKANSIDCEILQKGPIATLEKVVIGHSILLFLVLLAGFTILDTGLRLPLLFGAMITCIVSVVIHNIQITDKYHKDPMQLVLKERHKRLKNKHEEKYIVYLNLVYVLAKDSVINLDDNMFKVRGSRGNWKFKEISIGNVNSGDKLLMIDVNNLRCWSEN